MECMNVLIVTSHPSATGFTHKIAAAYKQEKEAQGGNVFVMDLYKKKYRQDFLCFDENDERCKPTSAQRAIHEKVLWSDEIVFVYPVWWFNPPAILKNFLDNNLVSGFAYRYSNAGKRSELLTGRTARIFATGDAPQWVYWGMHLPEWLKWKKGILGFCGVELESYDVFASMRTRRNDEERQRMLQRVRERARVHNKTSEGQL